MILSGAPHTIILPIDPPADASTISWSLRDNTAQAMSSYTAVAVANAAGANEAVIPIPGAANAKTVTTGSENRYVFVTWMFNGAPQFTATNYTIEDFAPVTVGYPEVRAVLGMAEMELAPWEVDINAAYLAVAADIGPTLLTSALIAGGTISIIANRLIAYRCAVDLGPSVMTRLAQLMASDTAKYQRLSKLDPQIIVSAIQNEYDRLRSILTSEVETLPTIFCRTRRAYAPVTVRLAPYADVWRSILA